MRVVTFKAVPGTERTYYYHRDHLGSTTLITNKSGEVVFSAEYDPWGVQTVTTNTIGYRSALCDAFIMEWRKNRSYCGHEMLRSALKYIGRKCCWRWFMVGI